MNGRLTHFVSYRTNWTKWPLVTFQSLGTKIYNTFEYISFHLGMTDSNVKRISQHVLLYVSVLTLSRQVSHAGVRFSCLSQPVDEKGADNVNH